MENVKSAFGWVMAIGTSAAISGSALAALSDSHALLAQLIQCKASAQDVVTFNRRHDNQQTGLKVAEAEAFWGDVAWTVEPSIAAMGKVSGVAIMSARTSFYLKLKASADVKSEIHRLGKEYGLEKTLDFENELRYRGPEGEATVDVYSLEEAGIKSHYLVGCQYDDTALEQARKDTLKAMPPRQTDKKRFGSP